MTRLGIALAALFVVGTAQADVESGPKAGEKVGELKVAVVIGDNAGKEIDAVADRKGPTVYLFVRSDAFSRPMFRFLKALDAKLKDTGDGTTAVAVWVGDDADKDKEYLKRAEKSLEFTGITLSVSGSGKAGPNGWGINTDAHLTAVVVAKGKVVKSFAYDTVNETDAKAVAESLKKAGGK